MNINRVTNKIPEPGKIQQGVLYVGKAVYKFGGEYKFHVLGEARLDGRKIEKGYYRGKVAHELHVPVGSAVIFDRYQPPMPEIVSPPPVPDIVNVDDIQARIDLAVQKRLELEMRQEDPQDFKQIMEYLHQEEKDEDESELWEYPVGLVDLDQYDENSLPAEPTDEAGAESENPRVGGDPEDRGESTAEEQAVSQ